MDSASANLVIAVAVPVLLLFVAACCNWRRALRHLLPVPFASFSDIVRCRRQLQHAAHATYSETAPNSVLALHSSFVGPRGSSHVWVRGETQPRSTSIALIAAPGLHPSPSQHQNGAMMSIQETASSRLSNTECVIGQLPSLSACNRLERGGAAGGLQEAVRVEAISKPLPVHETLHAPVQETRCNNGEP